MTVFGIHTHGSTHPAGAHDLPAAPTQANGAAAAAALAHAFPDLTAAQRERLQAHGRTRACSAGEAILAERAPSHTLYVVISGVAVVRKDSLTVPVSLDELRPGALFGEVSYIDGRVASASVIAREPLELLVLEQFDHILRSDPALAAGFYRSLAAVLADRLRMATEERATAALIWG